MAIRSVWNQTAATVQLITCNRLAQRGRTTDPALRADRLAAEPPADRVQSFDTSRKLAFVRATVPQGLAYQLRGVAQATRIDTVNVT